LVVHFVVVGEKAFVFISGFSQILVRGNVDRSFVFRLLDNFVFSGVGRTFFALEILLDAAVDAEASAVFPL
jgi:hypothetical protein